MFEPRRFSRLPHLLPLVACLGCYLLLPAPTPARESPVDTLPVTSWLVLGPVATSLPAFHDAEEGGCEAGELVTAPWDHLWPDSE